MQIDPRDIRVLRRVVTPAGARSGRASTSEIQRQPQPQLNQSVGIVTGKAMPDYPVPQMVFGLPDRSAASGDNMDDWFSRWIKPLMEQ